MRQAMKLTVPPQPLSQKLICRSGQSTGLSAVRMNVSPTFVLALFHKGRASSGDFIAADGRLSGHEEISLARLPSTISLLKSLVFGISTRICHHPPPVVAPQASWALCDLSTIGCNQRRASPNPGCEA